MEFTYFLAAELGLIVEEMEERMSNVEFVRWTIYYGRQAQRREVAQKMAAAKR